MAAMNKPYFDLSQEDMRLRLESYKSGFKMAWSALFPLRYSAKFDIKEIEGKEGIPVVADRVAFNTKAPKKTRRSIGGWSGKIEKISISREKDELEINDYLDLKAIAETRRTDKEQAKNIVDSIYEDFSFCNDGINARVELDSMRIASSGVHSFPANIDGDMATEDVIDFNIPAANKMGVSAPWSDAAKGDGLEDIEKAYNEIKKNGGRASKFVFMDASKFAELRKQEKTIRKVYPMAQAGILSSVDLTAINNHLAANMLPKIVIIDTNVTIEHKDGTQETINPWNKNVVTLSPEVQLGYTYYKPVPDVPNTEALQEHAEFYKVTRYSEPNPMLEVTMAEAYVQPALINRKSLGFINTDNTEWDNGESKMWAAVQTMKMAAPQEEVAEAPQEEVAEAPQEEVKTKKKGK